MECRSPACHNKTYFKSLYCPSCLQEIKQQENKEQFKIDWEMG